MSRYFPCIFIYKKTVYATQHTYTDETGKICQASPNRIILLPVPIYICIYRCLQVSDFKEQLAVCSKLHKLDVAVKKMGFPVISFKFHRMHVNKVYMCPYCIVSLPVKVDFTCKTN